MEKEVTSMNVCVLRRKRWRAKKKRNETKSWRKGDDDGDDKILNVYAHAMFVLQQQQQMNGKLKLIDLYEQAFMGHK